MDRLLNAFKRHAGTMDQSAGQPRWGVVSSVQQTSAGYEAKVVLQPEGVLTGWLPILAHQVGGGWGLISPPVPGQQAFVLPDCGDGGHGVIAGFAYSTQNMPPQPPAALGGSGLPVTPGEFALRSQAGAVLRFCADGTVYGKATMLNWEGDVTMRGTLTVQGDIHAVQFNGAGGDIYDRHGSVDRLRGNYNDHIHTDSHGDTTGQPTPQDPE